MLWTGQPAHGIRLRSSDLLAIPFSLLWAGFIFFGLFKATPQDQNTPLPFFFIPFLVVGVYLLFGRFFVDAALRARTYYAVTTQRVMILSGYWTRELRSLQLRTLPEIALREGSGSRGTIEFGTTFSSWRGWPRGMAWPGSNRYLPPSFDLIEEPRQVYNIIRKAQLEASQAQ